MESSITKKKTCRPTVIVIIEKKSIAIVIGLVNLGIYNQLVIVIGIYDGRLNSIRQTIIDNYTLLLLLLLLLMMMMTMLLMIHLSITTAIGKPTLIIIIIIIIMINIRIGGLIGVPIAIKAIIHAVVLGRMRGAIMIVITRVEIRSERVYALHRARMPSRLMLEHVALVIGLVVTIGAAEQLLLVVKVVVLLGLE